MKGGDYKVEEIVGYDIVKAKGGEVLTLALLEGYSSTGIIGKITGKAIMAKAKTVFVCRNCGTEAPKWIGKCPSCGEWNTFIEEVVVKTQRCCSQSFFFRQCVTSEAS